VETHLNNPNKHIHSNKQDFNGKLLSPEASRILEPAPGIPSGDLDACSRSSAGPI